MSHLSFLLITSPYHASMQSHYFYLKADKIRAVVNKHMHSLREEPLMDNILVSTHHDDDGDDDDSEDDDDDDDSEDAGDDDDNDFSVDFQLRTEDPATAWIQHGSCGQSPEVGW